MNAQSCGYQTVGTWWEGWTDWGARIVWLFHPWGVAKLSSLLREALCHPWELCASAVAASCKDKYWWLLAFILTPCEIVLCCILLPYAWNASVASFLFLLSLLCSHILPHQNVLSFLCSQLLMLFRLSAVRVEEQRDEDCIWKVKVLDPPKGVIMSYRAMKGKRKNVQEEAG